MLKNIWRVFILSFILPFTGVYQSQAQDYLEFNSNHSDCGLAINYGGNVNSVACKLVFTYNGSNLNLHFVSEVGSINFITTNLNLRSISTYSGTLYLAEGTYYLSHVRLTTSEGQTVTIDGKGDCKKTTSDITCIFNTSDGNKLVGIVRD
ncbi:MAG: hypothetical protein VKN60_02395 [Cyanobacteriota bacterium]|nr:hypothetical protein [Cyanobacteriota bacterium]